MLQTVCWAPADHTENVQTLIFFLAEFEIPNSLAERWCVLDWHQDVFLTANESVYDDYSIQPQTLFQNDRSLDQI